MTTPPGNIPQTPVESSLVKSYGYSQADRRLVVVFVDGQPFEYGDVPADLVQGFEASTSKGRYFHQHIRGRFNGKKLEVEAADEGMCPKCGGLGPFGKPCEDCGCANYTDLR